jgi:hypothetical protein
MMKSEFMDRTGFEPTEAEYRDIEAEYMGCDIDKDEFCKQWKKQGGIQRMMRLRARRIEELESQLVAEKRDYERMDTQYCTKINELKKQISDDGVALNSMNAQIGLMRNKAAGEIEELLKRANGAERKLAVLKEAFAIITGKEAE